MSAEKSGYLITVEWTDGTNTISFDAKSKTIPGLEGLGPIDINTDASPALAEQAPADQVKITTGTVTVIYDIDLFQTLRGAILKVGTLTFTSEYTSQSISFGNSWIQNVSPGSADIDGNPTMDVEFEFGGGASGEPTVS